MVPLVSENGTHSRIYDFFWDVRWHDCKWPLPGTNLGLFLKNTPEPVNGVPKEHIEDTQGLHFLIPTTVTKLFFPLVLTKCKLVEDFDWEFKVMWGQNMDRSLLDDRDVPQSQTHWTVQGGRGELNENVGFDRKGIEDKPKVFPFKSWRLNI